MSTPISQEQALQIAEDQRRHFNELVDVFDTPQPQEVMARLEEIVAAACLSPGEVVLDVGTGAGVLIPLIENCHPSAILACDLAENMLERVTQRHPAVRTHRADIALLSLPSASVDVIFMNAMYGNIADKSRACRNAAHMLPGTLTPSSRRRLRYYHRHLCGCPRLLLRLLPHLALVAGRHRQLPTRE